MKLSWVLVLNYVMDTKIVLDKNIELHVLVDIWDDYVVVINLCKSNIFMQI